MVAFPFSWSEVTAEESQRLKASFPDGLVNDLVRYSTGILMPRAYTAIAEDIYNFQLRDDDVWVVSYPKSGTTWTQEMTWMIINDMDKQSSQNIPNGVRSPFIETLCLTNLDYLQANNRLPDDEVLKKIIEDPLGYMNTMQGRRLIKSHLPMEFLPPKIIEKCKILYVGRNPNDTLVSYYHFSRNIPEYGFTGSFEEYVDLFEKGLLAYGSHWDHIMQAWRYKDHQNVKFVWFEDIKINVKSVIEEICTFLDHPLSASQIEDLSEYLEFDNMSQNKMANPTAGMKHASTANFMRKGEVGDWKNYLQEEMARHSKKWMELYRTGKGTKLMEKTGGL